MLCVTYFVNLKIGRLGKIKTMSFVKLALVTLKHSEAYLGACKQSLKIGSDGH